MRFGKKKRPDWDTYFLDVAEVIATRGDCIRCQVGAVVVGPDHRIKSTGYNGSRPGGPSCMDGECPRCLSDIPSGTGYEMCIEVHAEANALVHAAWEDLQNATLYLTREPCGICSKFIQVSGISRVVWRDEDGQKHALEVDRARAA